MRLSAVSKYVQALALPENRPLRTDHCSLVRGRRTGQHPLVRSVEHGHANEHASRIMVEVAVLAHSRLAPRHVRGDAQRSAVSGELLVGEFTANRASAAVTA